MKVGSRATIVLAGAAGIGAIVGVGSAIEPRAATNAGSYAERLGDCTVTDGDTIRCGGERLRLLGIDAPEMPGHCRPGRSCAPGDPQASTASLAAALSDEMTIERDGTDHYGRTLALVASPRGDLSCWQLRRRQAIYKPAWDSDLRVARACPAAIL